jgi:hypothetical protein
LVRFQIGKSTDDLLLWSWPSAPLPNKL